MPPLVIPLNVDSEGISIMFAKLSISYYYKEEFFEEFSVHVSDI